MDAPDAIEPSRLANAAANESSERVPSVRKRGHGDLSMKRAATPKDAVDRAALALRRSTEAHYRAADLHRRFADLLDAYGHPDRASEQRRLAVLADAAGNADAARERGTV